MSVVHVVILPISDVESLPPPQRAKRQSELARVALRRCAELAGAPLEGWTKNADDVPQPQYGWHWSIAHKPTMAVAAIARVPVGVDVERIVPRRNKGLFDHVADEDEWRIMGVRSWHSFYRLWTAKEAVLKANGVGIGSLGRCRVARATRDSVEAGFNGRGWNVSHYSCLEHAMGLAARGRNVVWHVLVRDTGTLFVSIPSDDDDEINVGLESLMAAPRVAASFRKSSRVQALTAALENYSESEWLRRLEDADRAALAVLRPGGLASKFFVGAVGGAIWTILCKEFHWPWWFDAALGGAIVAAIAGGLFWPAKLRRDRRLRHRFREYLSEHGVALCVQCGYDLRGQVEPRCPECGWQVKQGVSSGTNDR